MLDTPNRSPARSEAAAALPDRITAAIEARRVTLALPYGEDGTWTLLRYLDTRGGFRLGDVVRPLPPDARDDAVHYVEVLHRAGYLSGPIDSLMRIARPQIEAPKLTKSGRPRVQATRQACLWRVIRMLGLFYVEDLVAAATSDDLPITTTYAARYVEELAAAGYLIARSEYGRTLYRMKSRMNTGPAAPQVLRARFVWDPNTCQIVGAPQVEEAAR